MSDNKEVEIKLRLDPERIGAFTSLEILRDVESEKKHFTTIYFDDRKHGLERNGFELRVRSDGVRHVQTLKSVDGVDRGEWEVEVSKELPSLKELKKTPAAKLIRSIARMRPVFSMSIDRRTWKLSDGDGSAEVALDCGTLEAGSRVQPIYEAELELKEGGPEFLYELAAKVTSGLDASVSFVSKGRHGYRLAEKRAAAPEHAIDLHFDSDVAVEDAFKKIAAACLRQFSINEERLRIEPDSELAHQARVAMRRLRAAFSMFNRVVVGDDADEVRAGLKWVSDLLGSARDLDVFLESRVKMFRLEHPGVPGFEELTKRLEDMRVAAHAQLQEALRSDKFSRLMLSIIRCVRDGDWTATSPLLRQRPFLEFAESELQRRFEAVAKKKKAVRGQDALKRHHVRIKSKKLRYMAEFLKPLAPGKRFSKTSKQLEELQDLLGELNDAIAGERLLGRIVSEARNPAVSFAAGLIRQRHAISMELAQKAVKVHESLRHRKPLRVGI